MGGRGANSYARCTTARVLPLAKANDSKISTKQRIDAPPRFARRGRIRNQFQGEGQSQDQSQEAGTKRTTLELQDTHTLDATPPKSAPKPRYREGPYFLGNPHMPRVFPDTVFVDAWLECVRETYPRERELHQEVVELLLKMKFGGMDPLKAMERVAQLLPKDESVIHGFNQFLPFGYSIVYGKGSDDGARGPRVALYLPDVTVKTIEL